jgi:hypothetical protein
MRYYPKWLGRTIVLTANRYDLHVAQAVKEYAAICLFKPFLLTDLIATACRMLTGLAHTKAA